MSLLVAADADADAEDKTSSTALEPPSSRHFPPLLLSVLGGVNARIANPRSGSGNEERYADEDAGGESLSAAMVDVDVDSWMSMEDVLWYAVASTL